MCSTSWRVSMSQARCPHCGLEVKLSVDAPSAEAPLQIVCKCPNIFRVSHLERPTDMLRAVAIQAIMDMVNHPDGPGVTTPTAKDHLAPNFLP